MKASLIYLLIFLCGILGGYHFGQWNKPVTPPEARYAAVVTIDCFNHVEWLMILGPEKYRIMHASTMDDSQIEQFMEVTHPVILQTPDGLCV